METLQQAVSRLEGSGFSAAFRALPGGRLGVRASGGEDAVFAPGTLTVHEVVRFEGQSDPDDQAVLFALATPDDRFRGTFVAAYGPQMDAETVAAIEELEANVANRERHTGREGGNEERPAEISSWIGDALSAERFVKSGSAHLLDHDVLAGDAQAALLVRLVNERACSHVADLERLLDDRDAAPSSLRGALGAGLGFTLGLMERLPQRDLDRIVRDIYVALNYTAAAYHVLYTRAVLLDSAPAAELALAHLRDYTPAIRQLSHLLAWSSALAVPPERWEGKPVMNEIVGTLLECWSTDRASRADPEARS